MSLDEDGILELIHKTFPNSHPQFNLSRGDDCAVFSSSYPLAISTDLFVEDVHFRTSYFSASDIGHKALAVNLSDLAAMGAKPLAFSLGLCLPKEYAKESFLLPNLQAMAKLAEKYNIFLSGGDLSLSSKLAYCITVWGEEQHSIMQRGKIAEGDIVFVIGSFGLARAGLTILENKLDSTKYPYSILQHLQPDPKCNEAQLLAELSKKEKLRLALMDLSDGLLRDLPRLLDFKSHIELSLNIELDPADVDQEIHALCQELNLDPVLFALEGGEDYALLGACSPTSYERISKLVKTKKIGSVFANSANSGNGGGLIFYQAKQITKHGFDHFTK